METGFLYVLWCLSVFLYCFCLFPGYLQYFEKNYAHAHEARFVKMPMMPFVCIIDIILHPLFSFLYVAFGKLTLHARILLILKRDILYAHVAAATLKPMNAV